MVVVLGFHNPAAFMEGFALRFWAFSDADRDPFDEQ